MVSAALRLKTQNKAKIIYFCFEKSHPITLNQIEIMIIPVSPCLQKNSDFDGREKSHGCWVKCFYRVYCL